MHKLLKRTLHPKMIIQSFSITPMPMESRCKVGWKVVPLRFSVSWSCSFSCLIRNNAGMGETGLLCPNEILLSLFTDKQVSPKSGTLKSPPKGFDTSAISKTYYNLVRMQLIWNQSHTQYFNLFSAVLMFLLSPLTSCWEGFYYL